MMNGYRRWTGTLVAVAILLTGVTAAAVTDEERAGARAQAIAGANAFEAGQWQEALDRFERAESVVHSPVHLVYMARAQIELGQLVQAQERLLKVVQERLTPDAPEAFAQAKKEADALLTELEPRIPQLSVSIEGAGDRPVELTMDGKAVPEAFIGVPRPVNPGEHRFEAVADGMSGEAVVTLAEGAHESAVVQLSPDPESGAAGEGLATGMPMPDSESEPGGNAKALRYGSYAAFGVGAIGFGIGIPFALKRSDRQDNADDLFNQCNPGCTPSQQSIIRDVEDDANKAGTVATVGFITGGVGVAAGVTLLVLSLTQDDSDSAARGEQPRVHGFVGPNQLGVAGTF